MNPCLNACQIAYQAVRISAHCVGHDHSQDHITNTWPLLGTQTLRFNITYK